MKKIKIEIEGTSPLLMNSCENLMRPTAKKNPTQNYDNKYEAEKVTYRNNKKELIVPSRCLKACLLNASSWYKFGRKSAKQIIAGCTRIEPYELLLLDNKNKNLKKYDIDLRPVVIQKARIIRARPKLNFWRLKFDIIYNDDMIGDVEIIRSILEESGKRIGLLDNRPQKYGENGTFKIISFKIE